MFHDINQLHKVSIWMTNDKVSFIFIAEFKDLNKLLNVGKHKSVNDFVQNVVNTIENVIDEGSWIGYVIRWVYGKQNVYHTSQSDFHLQLYATPKNAESDSEIQIQKRLFDSLTQREKQLFTLLGEDLTENQICHELNLTMNCMKQHRKHIYSKMGLSSRKGVIFWMCKFSTIII